MVYRGRDEPAGRASGSNRITAARSQPITAGTARAMFAAISSAVAMLGERVRQLEQRAGGLRLRADSSTAVAESSAAATSRPYAWSTTRSCGKKRPTVLTADSRP